MLYMKSLGMVELKARLGDKMPNKKKVFFNTSFMGVDYLYLTFYVIFNIKARCANRGSQEIIYFRFLSI